MPHAKKIALAIGATSVALYLLWRRTRVPVSDNAIDFDNSRQIAIEDPKESSTTQAEVTAAVPPANAQNNSDERVIFACEGASIVLADGWYRTERDAAPPTPNVAVAVLTKTPPGSEQPSNDSPIIIFSIEDFNFVHLSLEEYVGKCLSTALEQARAMSNGRMQPSIDTNKPCSIGPFQHCVEYTNRMGEVEFHVSMYLAVIGTVGVTLQLLYPTLIHSTEYSTAFDAMAKTVNVVIPPPPQPFVDYYYIRQCIAAFEMSVEPAWNVRSIGSNVEVRSPSPRSDILTVYPKGSLPQGVLQLPILERRTLLSVEVTVRDPKTTVFSTNSVDVVCTRTSDTFSFPEMAVAAFAGSITVVKGAQAPRRAFVAVKERVNFAIEPNGFVFVSQLVRGTIIYFPLHNPTTGAPPSPGTAISCTVQFERDAPADVEGWLQQIASRSDPSEMEGITRRKVNDLEAIMLTERHPNHPLEITTMIIPTPNMSYFFQWEAATPEWSRFEPKFKAFLASLKINK